MTEKRTRKKGTYEQIEIEREDGTVERTERFYSKNKEKVTLGWIGNIEIYTKPKQMPNTVVIRQGEEVTKIDCEQDINKLFALINKTKHFLKGNWKDKDLEELKESVKWKKEARKLYEEGLNEDIEEIRKTKEERQENTGGNSSSGSSIEEHRELNGSNQKRRKTTSGSSRNKDQKSKESRNKASKSV